MTPEQFDRLPRYARDRILSLERDKNRAEEKLASMDKGISNVFMRDGMDMTALPPDSKIVFHLDGKNDKHKHSWSDRVTCYIEAGKLMVTGGMGMVIEPKSGNVVAVGTKD